MFDKQIKEFNENLLSLRDFVALIEPILIEKRSEHDRFVRPVFQLSIIDKLLMGDHADEEKKEKLLKTKEKLEEEIKDLYSDGISIELSNNSQGAVEVAIRSTETANFINNLKKTTSATAHINLLYKNALISLMSSVEWFFAQIMHYYYERFPNAFGIDSKTITFAELKTYNTVADAEKHLIEEKIESILRGSIESWFEFLKKDWGLGLSYVDSHLKNLIEISQRRNLFVHNGGVVNSIYLFKVSKELTEKVQIGKSLDVDKDYLDQSISKLQLTFILIAAEIWKKLDPLDENRAEIIGDIIYENMLSDRWDIANGLSYFTIKDNKMSSAHKVVGQLNYWLSRKRLGEKEAVLKEIEANDFSDKKEVYQLALFALKEDITEFFNLLPFVMDTQQLNTQRLEEFPIFREMRETKEYEDYKLLSDHFKKPSQPIIEE